MPTTGSPKTATQTTASDPNDWNLGDMPNGLPKKLSMLPNSPTQQLRILTKLRWMQMEIILFYTAMNLIPRVLA